MELIKIGFVLLSGVLFFAACAQTGSNTAIVSNNNTNNNSAAPVQAVTATPSPADELAAAREIYSKSCVGCHKENGEGGISEFEGKKIKAPNFKNPRIAKEPDAEYIEKIEKGDDGMPGFKDKLSEAEIKSLVLLIRREFQGKTGS
jgi:mono/diheme cytochrome c family protein